VAFVLTLLTFFIIGQRRNLMKINQIQRTCPPGPELLENDSSTKFLGIGVLDAVNFVTQSIASEFSCSFVNFKRAGGLGRPRTTPVVWIQRIRWGWKAWMPIDVRMGLRIMADNLNEVK